MDLVPCETIQSTQDTPNTKDYMQDVGHACPLLIKTTGVITEYCTIFYYWTVNLDLKTETPVSKSQGGSSVDLKPLISKVQPCSKYLLWI